MPIASEEGRIHFLFSGVEHRANLGRGITDIVRQHVERGNSHDRHLKGERQSFDRRDGDPQAGKGTGAQPQGDSLDFLHRQGSFPEKAVDGGHQPGRVGFGDLQGRLPDDPQARGGLSFHRCFHQSHAAGEGRGFDRQNEHLSIRLR
ncbi:MAG: hypothetical protein AMJ94_05735 [Deltaproteobacteria bacterium SM23_61]|nr:MAG: hypothetical protein AMJ94_05735 [Deltaproteobacteria bacterium SM23_61]